MNSLTPTQLANFETRLQARHATVLSAVQEHLHRPDDPKKMALSNYMDDGGDWIEAGLINEAELAKLQKELAELNEIESALVRIQNGTYGICASCGDAIPSERLAVQITSEYCLDCRKALEKRASLTGRGAA